MSGPAAFRDRRDAGRRLAVEVEKLGLHDPVVLALPRGGVAVAAEVARSLKAPLDLLLVRKLGVPGHEELAAGAIVEGDPPEVWVNHDIVGEWGISAAEMMREQARQQARIQAQRALYLSGRAPVPIEGRDAIVVDDGIATGATMAAALRGLRSRRPRRIVVAVPVAPPSSLSGLSSLADGIVCPVTTETFNAVGQFYDDFAQVEDDEVIATLAG